MDKLFLDANVLFTAAHHGAGKSAFLFDQLHLELWLLHSSEYAVEEARRNLVAKYPDRVTTLGALVRKLTVSRQPAGGECGIELAEKDQPIFMAAKAAAATHLLTGDLRHFKRYMNRPRLTSGIVIQTVSEYLAGL